MLKWIRRVLGAIVAGLTMAAAVMATGRAKDKRAAATSEAAAQSRVGQGTRAARDHRQRQERLTREAEKEIEAAAAKVDAIAKTDPEDLGAIMHAFNEERGK